MTEGQTRRVEAPEVRRAQIIEAAKQRFREAGFHATTMADIATSAAVSVGLLYRYFPSKDEIIRVIAEADLEAQLQTVETALQAHPDDRTAALHALIAGLVQLVTDRERTLLMLEIGAETVRSPALLQHAMAIDRRVSGLLKARFGGGLPPDESETRMRVMFNMLTALGFEVYRDPSKQALATKLTAQAVRQLLDPEAGAGDS
jgi:TetR/AcrR family transcriptional regulator, repressor for uid operon